MKLWNARFEKDTDTLVDRLNASLPFDRRLWREDIEGSVAHAEMLGRQGIIDPSESSRIVAGLEALMAALEAGQTELPANAEDIHMAVEALLTESLGQSGKRLHTGRSRNDQVALDLRLYVRNRIPGLIGLLLALIETLLTRARANLDTVMPGYTHLQRAQPVTLAHHLLAYANMFRRDITRLEDCAARMDESPLGAGALAGSTYPLDRDYTAARLGFTAPMDNSMDAVSDRDYAVEIVADLSILMMHLSRFAEEVILWCSWEFKFIELDDGYATGSSIMPQKKNPDVAELTRGKTGRVYGDLMALLTVMKGLPLAYNKDMQEDKEPVFDAIDTAAACLPVFTQMLATMQVKPDRMRSAAAEGFLNATDCADYLVKKGMPFRDAYGVTGRLVAQCTARGVTLETLPLADFQAASTLFEPDIYQAIDLQTCVEERRVYGGPARESVTRQMAAMEAFLQERQGREGAE